MSTKTYSILGCGWLGFPLAKHFIAKGHKIKGSTTSLEKVNDFKSEGITPYTVNIEENPDFKDFLNTDILLIMITSKRFEAYQNLVQAIETSSVKKVIFISSTSVYPRGNKTYTETDETIDSLLTKVEALFRNNTTFKTTIIRFAGLFGGQRQPGNWFKDKEIPQPNGFVNMIHRDDCIAIISKIIEFDIFGETFNACANHHPTRKAFYIQARKSLGKPIPVFNDSQPLQYKKISPEKLIKTLDYKFLHSDLLNI
ncbi:NAD(P)H-binding protein [Neotamlana laminarinivorans]|uniref:NAD(P)H-binding protein n=1 Tax=Neotamlana laminarinivorans TaxID=2883124 RepID=A0A9X1I0E5_9FLAO|nr:NAD(P)H-binding protein [Tamlana laminarinivorans]MCB4799126.1 NAD(P)H-binding protein [Tamlana laminarinivorans]